MTTKYPATLRLGDNGEDVVLLQEALRANGYAIKADGDFGPKTEAAVLQFQERKKVLQDGIVGRITWELLDETVEEPSDGWKDVPKLLRAVRVPVHQHGHSYKHFTCREDVAEDLVAVHAELVRQGGGLSSSGGLRSLNAKVGANRSAKSLHYIGLAVDLFVGGGMDHPETDPYVVVPDTENGRRCWVVYAHAPHAAILTLDAWVHRKQETVQIQRPLVNLTELFAAHGYQRISARKSYSARNYGASEWWHFQHEEHLHPHETRFGDELLKMYRLSQLQKAPPWRSRDEVWQKNWF